MGNFIFFTLMVIVMAVMQNGIALREPIKPFTYDTGRNLAKYHIAQILPPGQYKVVIWDKLIKTSRRPSMFFSSRADSTSSGGGGGGANGSSNHHQIFDPRWSKPRKHKFVFANNRNNFNDFGQHFAHFYSVETDNFGNFFVEKNGRVADWSLFNRHYNVNITPMKGQTLLKNDNTNMQKVYSLGIRVPVDSLCNFREHCFINYFETFNEWELLMQTIFRIYLLSEPCYGVMPDNINFFLIASLRQVIIEANTKRVRGKPMNAEEAGILSLYFNKFVTAKKNRILMERIRLVDRQMLQVVDEFCKIDTAYLIRQIDMEHDLQQEDYEAFCPSWAIVRDKLSRFNKEAYSMNAFYKWLSSPSRPDDEIRETVHFWFAIFSRWLKDYRISAPWLDLDLNMFKQIGQLLVGAKAGQLLTTEKIQQIPGVDRLLVEICCNTHDIMEFLVANGIEWHKCIDQWRTKVCSGAKFEYSTAPLTIPTVNSLIIPTVNSLTIPTVNFLTIPAVNSPSPQRNSGSLTPQKRKPPQMAQYFSKRINSETDDKDGEQTFASSSSSNSSCVICLSENRDFAFVPCFHLCGCDACTDKVLKAQNAQCPICRKPIEGKVRIYQP